jgi:hypothetical protein
MPIATSRRQSHIYAVRRGHNRKGETEITMFVLKWSKRLIETLRRIDAKCTEATEMHGRYCISDAKIRARS